MTEPPPYRETGDEIGAGLERESTGTPRWVKVFGIIAGVVVLLLVILLLAGGNHGPGRHMPSGGGSGDATPAAGHTPPAGGHTP